MRRRLTALPAAAVLAAPLLLTACSGAGDVMVKVKGDYGQRPEVSFPKGDPAEGLAVRTLEDGKGAEARKGDLVVADYVGYRWSKDGRKLLASSFAGGRPGAFPTGLLVPGLDRALTGARPGSRVVAKIPPEDGYGDKGDSVHQVGADDTLVYVLDVRAVYPRTAAAKGAMRAPSGAGLPRVAPAAAGGAPAITVPRSAAPKALRACTLIEGGGPRVGKGQLLALQYEGVFWRDGKVFDSSWADGRASAATIGTGQVMKGWDQALIGQKVGSRVLVVVPPALGYGAKGLAQAGIKGSDTLVFVVDVLGAHGKSSGDAAPVEAGCS
ncbi:FKBP-type peptidyl-prolyl cis-trans isomerase [Spirillospora sp. NBC_01491]|uniref:FKBP-type peptidyl-prolyl cis-trans isomerase n=1 Tax=Spirillospora sp. NBC_01491 TaxID=2976007 RepID=UPI002E34EE88|nr:FKBP-type peptidyl-prolyl cis-trans isomerase [Spirillospora sp. NBC_01491]